MSRSQQHRGRVWWSRCRNVAAIAALLVFGVPGASFAHSHHLDLRLSELDFNEQAGNPPSRWDSLFVATTPEPLTSSSGLSDGSAEPSAASDEPSRDWDGLKQDTVYFLGYQFVIIGLLYMMPENISSWSEEEKEKYSFGKWKNNVTEPVKDEDDYFINYVLHPYWGAAYYIRARERGYPGWNAFGYSVMLSTLYEYGAEALFEPVSAQDLIVTPVAGSLLGGFVFEPLRARIKRKPQPRSFSDQFLLVATDPLGAANHLAEELLGRNAGATLSLDVVPRKGLRTEDYVGLRLAFRW